MRLLILGGTAFLGRTVAQHASEAGHHVTCLARGDSGAPIDGVRFLRADRDQPDGLSILDGEQFDAAVDVTRRPSHARRAVQALADRVGHWCYVSTISVYSDHATPHQRADTAPVLPPAPPEVDDPAGNPEQYGPCKVACELAVREHVAADRALIARAGLIVGPGDDSGRFGYWVDRIVRGGRVLAPGDPTDLVQLVDGRDLAAWLVRAAEQGLAGTYDTIGAPLTRAEMLARVATGVAAEPTLTWVDQEFLQAQRVQPWAGERSLPLWLPLPEYGGHLTRDAGPVLAAGLPTRPIAETAADALAWLRTTPGQPAGAGLTAAEEAELLQAWDQRLAEPGRTVSA